MMSRKAKTTDTLVIISNAEQYNDGSQVHIRFGFGTQIEELAHHFQNTFLYSPAVDYQFEGYTYSDEVICRPLVQGLPYRARARRCRSERLD